MGHECAGRILRASAHPGKDVRVAAREGLACFSDSVSRLGAAAVWSVAGPAVSQDAMPRLRADQGHGARRGPNQPTGSLVMRPASIPSPIQVRVTRPGPARPGPGLLLEAAVLTGFASQDRGPSQRPVELETRSRRT